MTSRGVSLTLAAHRLDALNLRDVKHLARHLSIGVNALKELAANVGRYVHPFSKKVEKKTRRLYRTEEPLKGVLIRLNLLLQRLKLPRSLHGSVRGRSCLTNAHPHLNARAWLQLDIKDFFPSIDSKRVYNMFVADCGCSPDVARLLTQITTTEGHLPQGFPTSPAIANLVARPLTRRLAKLAFQHGARFTQYLDDMTISGPEHVLRLKNTALKIIQQEGFSVSPNKIRVSRKGQECVVTGVRVDQGIDAPTALKESVHSRILLFENSGCSANSKEIASLRGTIAHVARLNPRFGGRMMDRADGRINGGRRNKKGNGRDGTPRLRLNADHRVAGKIENGLG